MLVMPQLLAWLHLYSYCNISKHTPCGVYELAGMQHILCMHFVTVASEACPGGDRASKLSCAFVRNIHGNVSVILSACTLCGKVYAEAHSRIINRYGRQ
jgi:hypothetical protein